MLVNLHKVILAEDVEFCKSLTIYLVTTTCFHLHGLLQTVLNNLFSKLHLPAVYHSVDNESIFKMTYKTQIALDVPTGAQWLTSHH